MKLVEAQLAARACLLANIAFQGLDLFVELDPSATPVQLRAFDAQFELALATKGLAVVILSPHGLTLGQAKPLGGGRAGALSLDLIVPIAICENPEINRGEPDPTATPPRAPARRHALELLEAAISALATTFHFPAQPFGRPEFADGFWAYYLLAQRQHLIRSP